MKHGINTIEEVSDAARKLAARLVPTNEGATVVTLSGDLGAGKTTFARAFARAFGIEEEITSPTYVIEKIYKPSTGPFERFIHVDAYRLNGAHDLEVLGWRELLQESGDLIVVEWPEKVEGAIPQDAIRIALELSKDDSRTITYDI